MLNARVLCLAAPVAAASIEEKFGRCRATVQPALKRRRQFRGVAAGVSTRRETVPQESGPVRYEALRCPRLSSLHYVGHLKMKNLNRTNVCRWRGVQLRICPRNRPALFQCRLLLLPRCGRQKHLCQMQMSWCRSPRWRQETLTSKSNGMYVTLSDKSRLKSKLTGFQRWMVKIKNRHMVLERKIVMGTGFHSGCSAHLWRYHPLNQLCAVP